MKEVSLPNCQTNLVILLLGLLKYFLNGTQLTTWADTSLHLFTYLSAPLLISSPGLSGVRSCLPRALWFKKTFVPDGLRVGYYCTIDEYDKDYPMYRLKLPTLCWEYLFKSQHLHWHCVSKKTVLDQICGDHFAPATTVVFLLRSSSYERNE